MAIQIPSAAGFIPNESVLDGINKIMMLATQKQRQQAALDQTIAQTGALNASAEATRTNTSFVPDQVNRDWTKVLSGVNLDTAQAGHLNADTAVVPRRVANEEKRTENDYTQGLQKLELTRNEITEMNRRNQAEEDYKNRALEANVTDAAAKNAIDVQRTNVMERDATNRNTLGMAELDAKKAAETQRMMLQKHDELLKMLQMTPGGTPENDSKRAQYEYQVIRDLSPELGAKLIENVRKEEATRRAYEERLRGYGLPTIPVPDKHSAPTD